VRTLSSIGISTLKPLPLEQVIERRNFRRTFYAYDTQLSLLFDPADARTAMAELNCCLAIIQLDVINNFTLPS